MATIHKFTTLNEAVRFFSYAADGPLPSALRCWRGGNERSLMCAIEEEYEILLHHRGADLDSVDLASPRHIDRSRQGERVRYSFVNSDGRRVILETAHPHHVVAVFHPLDRSEWRAWAAAPE